MRVLCIVLMTATLSAAEPKTIYVAVPPLKTDTAKAATELVRLLKRKPKEVTVVESADAAEFTVDIVSVTKRAVGDQISGVATGRTDTIQATFVAAKLCIRASNTCDTVEGDSSAQAFQIGSLNSATLEVDGKIRKAIK